MNECISAPVAASADHQTATDIRLERQQLYIYHLESIILSRHSETTDLNSNLEARVEEMRQKQLEHECIMIYQARRAAAGEVLGMIAHKWRQPLNAISLSVQNLTDAWEFGEINEELLNRSTARVMEQVNLLSKTIDDYRSFISPSVTAEHFNPIQCVKVQAPLLTSLFSCFTAIEIRDTDVIKDDIQIAGSQDAFQQVMHNLLSNANDAVQEQQCRVGTAFYGVITVDFRRVKNDIIITVADNGGGISESIQEHIFDPFFTTKPNNSGLGIGLHLSKTIIENNMNGSLWFENIPGGARFNIRLPLLTGYKRLL